MIIIFFLLHCDMLHLKMIVMVADGDIIIQITVNYQFNLISIDFGGKEIKNKLIRLCY